MAWRMTDRERAMRMMVEYSEQRAALEAIIVAADANPNPIHYAVRAAIQHAREVIQAHDAPAGAR